LKKGGETGKSGLIFRGARGSRKGLSVSNVRFNGRLKEVRMGREKHFGFRFFRI
jgi:hypothetical protein